MLAQNIRKLRLRNRLSQEKLSRLADIATATLVKIEAGIAKEPTITTITKIADALDVSIDMLVGRMKRKG
ncbi:MAG: helix-turn-helix domain-containing protein [Candidatus Omnitrophica bacterium]|nr:helix-turn-helix domain-containing protein [Candidatus Omnitrophota bacterium]MDO9572623.1 helix-turn-helix transcriptional regulator [Candidatus Omnitrophota bacterium]